MNTKKYFRFRYISFCLIIFLLACNLCFSSQLSISIQSLLEKYKLSRASVGISILNASTGMEVFSHNSNKNYYPASNTKILTAATALATLGNDFHFKTSLYFDKLLDNSTINHLYLDLSGDPGFTSGDLFSMLQKLKDLGVKSINHISIVNRFFTGRDYPINMSSTAQFFYYGAPSSIYNMNGNTMIFRVEGKNGKFQIKQLSEPKYPVINNLTQISGKSLCQFNGSVLADNKVEFNGCMPNGKYQLKVSVSSPKLFMSNFIMSTLSSMGITLESNVNTLYKIPNNVSLLVTHKSPALPDMLNVMMLYSNNLYAQTFTRVLGYYTNGIGSIVSGKDAIIESLNKDLKIDTSSIQLEDGAGMSNNDLLSASLLTKTLYAIKYQKYGKEFISFLPVYGVSGTLKHRTNKGLTGNIHAKTGTGTTNIALSGYIQSHKGKKYIFSILMSNLSKQEFSSAYAFQDNLLSRIAQVS